MANYERGVYEPSDEVRVFDGSDDEDDVEGSRLPLLIVLALLVLAMFGGVVWLAYTQGVARGRTEPRVLTAETGPVKVTPQDSGGTETPYKGFKIYEQPAPADDAADAPPANAPAAKPPAAAAVTPVPTPAPSAMTQAAPPPAKVQAPAVAPPKPAPVIAKAEPPKKVVAEAAPAPDVATAPPKELSDAAPAAKPPTAAPSVSSGGYFLQIGAYKSDAEAQAAWSAYRSKHAALLSGTAPDVQKVDLGAKGTWYRLRASGFADKDGAGALCDKLKADGGNCFLAK